MTLVCEIQEALCGPVPCFLLVYYVLTLVVFAISKNHTKEYLSGPIGFHQVVVMRRYRCLCRSMNSHKAWIDDSGKPNLHSKFIPSPLEVYIFTTLRAFRLLRYFTSPLFSFSPVRVFKAIALGERAVGAVVSAQPTNTVLSGMLEIGWYIFTQRLILNFRRPQED